MSDKQLHKELQQLRSLWSGFMPSRILLTANNLRIFDLLTGWRSLEEVSCELKSDSRATEILLDALTALGLLRKRGDRYKNSLVSQRFLVSSSPMYQGNIIRHADTLWKSWSGLDDILKTGRPSRTSQWNLEAFILGMHDIAKLRAKEVLALLPLNGVKKVLDLGGGPGTYAIEMAKAGLDVTLFDRLEVLEIARGIIRKASVEHKIKLLSGDFMHDNFGQGYDMIFLSQVLHAYSEEENMTLLYKIKDSLTEKGRVVIQEFYLNQNRTSPLKGALFSVNMLVNTPAGRTYTAEEIKKWLRCCGFRGVRTRRLEDTVLVIGRV